MAFDTVVRIPRIQRRSLREPLRVCVFEMRVLRPIFSQLTILGIQLTLAATYAREKEAPFALCVSAVSVHVCPLSSHVLTRR